MHTVNIGSLAVSNDLPLLVIAGPCQLESTDHAQMIAGQMAEVCARHGAQFVFKGSYDKANRTSLSGKRGLGIQEGLKALQSVKDAIGCPVLTDVHGPEQCAEVSEVVDILQMLFEEGSQKRLVPQVLMRIAFCLSLAMIVSVLFNFRSKKLIRF